jgi:hypothetical protein
MSRQLRFIPAPGALVEVTDRTLHGRFLLRPGPQLNPIIVGALVRAQHRYPVRICGFTFLSFHFHLLLQVANARELAGFMGLFTSRIAREIGRITGWREKILAPPWLLGHLLGQHLLGRHLLGLLGLGRWPRLAPLPKVACRA